MKSQISPSPTNHHPIVLTVTSGRSGSSWLYRTFHDSFGGEASIYHEYLNLREAKPAQYFRAYSGDRLAAMRAEPAVSAFIAKVREESALGPVIDFGWTMSSLIPLFKEEFGSTLKVLILRRHPVDAAASMALMGLYSAYERPDEYALSPTCIGTIGTVTDVEWSKYTEFEKLLYRWLELVRYGQELQAVYPENDFFEVESSSLWKNPDILRQVAVFCGVDPSRVRPSNFRNSSRDENREWRPLGLDWEAFRKHRDVIRVAGELGYEFDHQSLASRMSKYQLPPGLLPWLRNKTRYWALRRRLTELLTNAPISNQEVGQ